jgi:hypothetical protein
MRYWSYNEYDPDSPLADETGGYVVTLSEKEILDRYWDYWCKRMYEVGKDPEVHTFQDCIDDWVIVNWAWESTNDTSS